MMPLPSPPRKYARGAGRERVDCLRLPTKALRHYETRGAAPAMGVAVCDGAGAGAIGAAAGVTGCVVEGTGAAGVPTGCTGLGAGAVGEEVAGAVGVTVPLMAAFCFDPMV